MRSDESGFWLFLFFHFKRIILNEKKKNEIKLLCELLGERTLGGVSFIE